MTGPTSNRVLPAALCLIGYAAILGLIDNFVRLIAQEGGLWQFHAMRAVMVFAILAVVAAPLGLSLRVKRWPALIGRSLLHGTAMLIYFGCLAYLSVPQVAAGLFTAPIFVLIFSWLFFGHHLTPREIGATALGFAGVLLVLQPGVAAPLGWVMVFPIFAGALYALGSLATREWCADESATVLMAGMFVVLGVAGAMGMAALALWPVPVPPGAEGFIARGWIWPSAGVLGWTLVQAVGSMIAVGIMVRGYQIAEARQIAIFEYVLLPVAAIWGFLLYGEQTGAVAMIGMGLIFVGGALIAMASR